MLVNYTTKKSVKRGVIFARLRYYDEMVDPYNYEFIWFDTKKVNVSDFSGYIFLKYETEKFGDPLIIIGENFDFKNRVAKAKFIAGFSPHGVKYRHLSDDHETRTHKIIFNAPGYITKFFSNSTTIHSEVFFITESYQKVIIVSTEDGARESPAYFVGAPEIEVYGFQPELTSNKRRETTQLLLTLKMDYPQLIMYWSTGLYIIMPKKDLAKYLKVREYLYDLDIPYMSVDMVAVYNRLRKLIELFS